MKNSRKEIALVASGIILGATLAAPVAGAALTVQHSSQKITVDGKPVQIEAYSINGSNYAKLRDVSKAVGFSVAYNALTNTVEINTTEPYTETAPTSRTVVLPTDGSQYVPQVGDRILCDDGTEYEIKDVTRWDNNVFQSEKLPPLPDADLRLKRLPDAHAATAHRKALPRRARRRPVYPQRVRGAPYGVHDLQRHRRRA